MSQVAGALTPAADPATMQGPSRWNATGDGPTSMSMSSRTRDFEEAGPTGSSSPEVVAYPEGSLPLLVLSAWCGLIAGLLEVGATLLRRRVLDVNQLYKLSRHFVWLIPLGDLAIFLV